MGGGRGFFTPQTTAGSSRKDNLNLLDIAKNSGYHVFTDRNGFDLLRNGLGQAAKLPYMGLFTNSEFFTYSMFSMIQFNIIRPHELRD
jgi:alkaline phosphatase